MPPLRAHSPAISFSVLPPTCASAAGAVRVIAASAAAAITAAFTPRRNLAALALLLTVVVMVFSLVLVGRGTVCPDVAGVDTASGQPLGGFMDDAWMIHGWHAAPL